METQEQELFIDDPEANGATPVGSEEETVSDASAEALPAETAEETAEKKEDEEGKEKEAEPVAPSFYTAEEIRAVLESDGTLDRNKLSDEGKLIQKEFERGFSKKFQEAAELRKQALAVLQAQPKEQPKDQIYQLYLQDPRRVVGDVEAEIERLEAVDPYSDEYQTARKSIAKLHALKTDLEIHRRDVIEAERTKQASAVIARAEIAKDIPDFETKRVVLNQFAIDAGLEQSDIDFITDPTIHGDIAVRLTKAINKIHGMLNVANNADKKRVPIKPQSTISAGARSSSESAVKSPDKMTYSEYKEWRAKK